MCHLFVFLFFFGGVVSVVLWGFMDINNISLVIKLQMHAHPHMRLVIMSATLQVILPCAP